MIDKFKVQKLELNKDQHSGVDMVVAWLLRAGYEDATPLELFKSGINPYKPLAFIFSFLTEIGKKIVRNPEHVIELELNDFIEGDLGIDEDTENAYFHYEYWDIKFEAQEKHVELNVKSVFLCQSCKTDNICLIPLNIPKFVSFGLTDFLTVIKNFDLNCKFCGRYGKLGDETFFKLSETKGLIDDLIPLVSNYEKHLWYYNLHEHLRSYLQIVILLPKKLFEIDLYKAEFSLSLNNILIKPSSVFGVYFIDNIVLENSIIFNDFEKIPLIFEYNEHKDVEKNLIIEFDQYDFLSIENALMIKKR